MAVEIDHAIWKQECGALAGEGFRAFVARTLTLDQYRVAWGRARAR